LKEGALSHVGWHAHSRWTRRRVRIFESPIARFSYDQVVGPAAVRVGIWAYLVVGQRLGSLKVTAA